MAAARSQSAGSRSHDGDASLTDRGVLTPDAAAFVTALERRFRPERRRLLAEQGRATVQRWTAPEAA
ncbi:MAG: hypothetical protein HOV83_14840 [Catenulispora sp.]|nr:hypothetical protein [Catenulispora sp.]